MVEKGSGYAIIDDFSASIYGDKISIHDIDPGIGYQICMISNKEKPLSVRRRVFYQFS
jgi:hypothetical protein